MGEHDYFLRHPRWTVFLVFVVFFFPLLQFNETRMDLRKRDCGKLKRFQKSYPFLLIFIGPTFKDGVLDSDKQDGNSFFSSPQWTDFNLEKTLHFSPCPSSARIYTRLDVCLCDSLPLSLKSWEKQQNAVSEYYYPSGRQRWVSVSYLKACVIFKLFDISPN